RLGRNRRIRRAAAHGEIIADGHHGAAIDLAAAKYAVGRRDVLQFALLVVFRGTGDRSDFVEASLVEQGIDTFANGKSALVTLTLDLVDAAHLAREGLAPGQLVEFRLPAH